MNAEKPTATADASARGHAPADSGDETPEQAGGTFADRMIAVVVILLALTLLLLTFGFPAPAQPEDPGTAILPRLVGAALLVLGLALMLRPETAAVAPPRGARGRLTASVIATATLVFLVVPLGFPVAIALFLAFALWLMGVRKVLGLVLYPIIASGFLYYLFADLLDVYLPAGILEGVL
ncbi:tripartite tricarboxylate transporter TctB family protein [Kocuria coralli]|uniref:Tripartite tricarboxylate transporter TctB family protein n=1 Tax=Kocuria coralli TaxID=1461025 RepID=A0A5J5L2T9_9MICC|nr:tripartite tricarboxylate transporter TctB family protein [Kocuria coralli]KAA9395406.1 tripartite tricarboxylate transporter TctB family protein [Kocuria coralli]